MPGAYLKSTHIGEANVKPLSCVWFRMTTDRSQTSLRNELAELKREMEEDPLLGDDLFFFPTHEEVQGYWGTDPVWFVGQKPSKGGSGFPDRAVTLLYETLVNYEFENAHITDITKERGYVPSDWKKIRVKEVERMRPYFRREIELLCPSVLVAMGQYVYNALKYMEATDGTRLEYIPHYSWAIRTDENRARFVEDVNQIAEMSDVK
jgi:uracil-DNA glycosylase